MSAATQQTGRYRMRFCAACGTVFTFDNRNARRDRRTLCPECRLSVGNQERKESRGGPMSHGSDVHLRIMRKEAKRRKTALVEFLAECDAKHPPVPEAVVKIGREKVVYRGTIPGGTITCLGRLPEPKI